MGENTRGKIQYNVQGDQDRTVTELLKVRRQKEQASDDSEDEDGK